MIRYKSLSPILLCAGALLAGCAHAPPTELVNARQAYQHASASPAAQVAPAELHKAAEALAAAEQAFSSEPEGQLTRDLSYVAQRKAQLAEALAAAQLDSQNKAQADREYLKQQNQLAQQTKSALVQTREQLREAERARQQEGQQLNAERQARLDAEQRAADADRQAKEASAALAKLAAIKEEQRGLVITLSGSVLFATDQATLLPEAQTRLGQVAEALMATKERNIVVEGYTDSKGTDSHNLDLSQRRADAVREYLVSRGYPPERIQSRGLGKERPVASNASAEGRANNRRVEIIVQPRDTLKAAR